MTNLIDPKILRLLKCPCCPHGRLIEKEERLVCAECGRSYGVVDHVPDLLPENASLSDRSASQEAESAIR